LSGMNPTSNRRLRVLTGLSLAARRSEFDITKINLNIIKTYLITYFLICT